MDLSIIQFLLQYVNKFVKKEMSKNPHNVTLTIIQN